MLRGVYRLNNHHGSGLENSWVMASLAPEGLCFDARICDAKTDECI